LLCQGGDGRKSKKQSETHEGEYRKSGLVGE
jgi:hypothetical protein